MPPMDCRFATTASRECARAKLGPMAADVNSFLEGIYWMAETLPDVADVQKLEADASRGGDLACIEDTTYVIDEGLRESASQPSGSQIRCCVGYADVEPEGPRYLQPGSWVEIFKTYVADREVKGTTAASWATFFRTWKSRWSTLLVHRGKNSFGKCNTCVKYKEVLKQCSSIESRLYWATQYSRHLLSQYRDRQCYYHERSLSQSTARAQLIGPSSTLTIIIDAMDQAKFCVPRHLPAAKSLKDALRPRLHVVGVIAHGFFKAGFLVDPSIQKDSNLFIEIIVRTLDGVMTHCRDKKIDMPTRLVVVSDNAGDNKNKFTMTLSAVLAAIQLFKLTFNIYLRTGHSHEDIDAMFGCWARCLLLQATLETPDEFRAALATQFPDTRPCLLNIK